MREALIVSFNLIRYGEPEISLSVASLLATARAAYDAGSGLFVRHRAYNLLGQHPVTPEHVVASLHEAFPLDRFVAIAISVYVWCENLVRPVMQALRVAGYKGRFVLGGHQISYTEDEELHARYPEADAFVKGYAETSLLDAFANGMNGRIFSNKPALSKLPSPFLSGTLPVEQGQASVRIETKRGCPYRCNYCAHRDPHDCRIYYYGKERVYAELSLMGRLNVRKINVLDPVFNIGRNYLAILRNLAQRHFAPQISLQCRLENIHEEEGDTFIKLCSELKACLEFGVQSIHEAELLAINRKAEKSHILKVFEALNISGVRYEASIIYGLPNQTQETFESTVTFLKEAGCPVIKAFPLMLLRGTTLYNERTKYGLKERPMGPFSIPTVYESNTFDEDSWQAMARIASILNESHCENV